MQTGGCDWVIIASLDFGFYAESSIFFVSFAAFLFSFIMCFDVSGDTTSHVATYIFFASILHKRLKLYIENGIVIVYSLHRCDENSFFSR